MSHVVLISPYDRGALGARHLSAFLKTNGHRVSLVFFKRYRNGLKATLDSLPDAELHEGLDLCGRETILGISTAVTSEEREILRGLIGELEPDLVGFSLRTIAMRTAAILSRDLRESPGAPPIVWGGIGPTLEPERCLEDCDFVCRGEGEDALLELTEALERGEGWDGIANLWGNAREGRPAFQNPPRPLIRDLDALPFADMSPEGKFTVEEDRLVRDDPAVSNYDWLYELVSTRGCPFDCSYCCNESIHRLYPGQPKVRRRSPEHVVDELADAVGNHRVERVNFQDDVFSMNPKWLARFCELYKERVGAPFWSYVHPKGLKRETLERLRDAGMRWSTIGVQSGSRRILEETYNRRHEPEEIVKVARWLRELGVDVNVDIITNNPYERPEDCLATLQLLVDLPKGVRLNAGISKLSVFPKTRMARLLEESPPPEPPAGEAFRDTFNVLYLISRQSRLPGGLWMAMGRNAFLLRHPGFVRPFLWSVRLRKGFGESVRFFGSLPKRILPDSVWGILKNLKSKFVRTGK